jgi:hypothetical protein
VLEKSWNESVLEDKISKHPIAFSSTLAYLP